MAIIGNAKNARVVVNMAGTGFGNYQIILTIRGNKYRFDMDDNAGYLRYTQIFLQPNTAIGSKYFVASPTTIEVIDNRLRIWGGINTWENTAVADRLEVVDNTHLVSGAWDLTMGTLVSFENLDAPAPSGTNMQLNLGTAFKTVESAQLQVGGTWRPVTGASLRNETGWKTVF